MTSNNPLGIAIVGCGGMAGSHLRAYRELAQSAPGLIMVSATCDVDEARARRAAAAVAEFQSEPPRVYTDFRRLLDEHRPAAVDLVLPHNVHHTFVVEALDAGAHVLVEKPLAISMAAGRRLLAAHERASQRSPLVLAVAEQYRRRPEERTNYWAICDAGLIGEPRMIFSQRVNLSMGLIVGTAWRHDRLLSGGGWVLDGEVHTFDLFHYLFGPIATVYAAVRTFEPLRYQDPQTLSGPTPSDVEDAAIAVLTFESGLIANFTWTQAAPGKAFQRRRYYGSDGSLDEDGLHRRDGTVVSSAELQKQFLASLTPEQKETLFPYDTRDPVVVEIVDFVRAIRDGTAPEVDGREGLAAMAVSEALYESEHAGTPITVADVEAGRVRAAQHDIDAHWGLL